MDLPAPKDGRRCVVKTPHRKSGWTVAHLTRRLHEEQATLDKIEASTHPFRAEMLQGQRERIKAIRHHLSQKP